MYNIVENMYLVHSIDRKKERGAVQGGFSCGILAHKSLR